MKRVLLLSGITAVGVVTLSLQACSSADNPAAAPGVDSGAADSTAMIDSAVDATPANDTGTDTGTVDTGTDAGCPANWTIAPVVDAPIALPDGGGGVLLHASATGTQDYTCSAATVDGGTTYAWTFTGPEADLADCTMVKIGKHFASDGGPTAPEWMTLSDGTYVIAKKLAAETPDGGGSAIPWLLLQATSSGGGSGTLSRTAYVQRINTTGGKAPATTCDATTMGMSQKVAYTADYYFYGM